MHATSSLPSHLLCLSSHISSSPEVLLIRATSDIRLSAVTHICPHHPLNCFESIYTIGTSGHHLLLGIPFPLSLILVVLILLEFSPASLIAPQAPFPLSPMPCRFSLRFFHPGPLTLGDLLSSHDSSLPHEHWWCLVPVSAPAPDSSHQLPSGSVCLHWCLRVQASKAELILCLIPFYLPHLLFLYPVKGISTHLVAQTWCCDSIPMFNFTINTSNQA